MLVSKLPQSGAEPKRLYYRSKHPRHVPIDFPTVSGSLNDVLFDQQAIKPQKRKVRFLG